MNPFLQFCNAIAEHIARHGEAYGTAAVGLALAVAKNIPELIPKSAQDWWTWMRSSVQTALPISRTSTPQQPVGPAK